MILLTLSPQKRGLILTLFLPATIDDDNLTLSQPDDKLTLITFTGRERVKFVLLKFMILTPPHPAKIDFLRNDFNPFPYCQSLMINLKSSFFLRSSIFVGEEGLKS